MLGQEDPDYSFMIKTSEVFYWEDRIDTDRTLYLITWNPDPKELPNADFETQHHYSVNLLSDYLKACECGLFCVETSQLGAPHYHGWYQVSQNPDCERNRIIYIKTMQRFGNLKITKSKGHYKIGSNSNHANCLLLLQKRFIIWHGMD